MTTQVERDRREQLAGNLQRVRAQIAAAATAAGRDPDDITLVVVTKTFPVSDIALLSDLGVKDIGENRHPEAATKAAALADRDLVWHFIGQLQSNKAPQVATYADVVHSVDSVRLARRLGRGAEAAGRSLICLVQVNLDPPAAAVGRGGTAPSDLLAVAEAIETTSGLSLGGVMAVAPLGEPPEAAFARLAGVAAELRSIHPAATVISAGMSGDFPAAISHGATHVRVGSAVLGSRPPLG